MISTRVVYLDIGSITVEHTELPELKPNELLIKTHQASICGSERFYYRGVTVRPEDEAKGEGPWPKPIAEGGSKRAYSYPMGPLGHEGGGTIEEMGSGVEEYLGGGKVKSGDRVGSLTYPTYSDYWVAHISQVQPIPEGVSFTVGCLYEPLGCAAWAAIQMGVRLGDTVAVNGVGFAGNILLQGALRAGASRTFAIDVDDRKLQIDKELGADHTINPRAADPVEVVHDLTHGEGVDVSAEAVGGTGQALKQAYDMVRHNGILALYGDNYAPVRDFCFHRFHEDGLEIRNLNAVHYTGLRSVENMREAFRAVERGVFNLDIILENSDRHSLDKIAEVFANEAERSDAQPSLKTIISP